MDLDAAKQIVLVQFALYALYDEFGTKGTFNMATYDSATKHLDDAFAICMGKENTKTYPNPCGEILIGGSR